MALILRATRIEHRADSDPAFRWMDNWLEVVDPKTPVSGKRWEHCDPRFRLMCNAIMGDVQSAEGSGADFLKGIALIESGATKLIEADGNAWVAHITRDKVWFEGLYNQGEGGEVSFAQYKLAVETYVRFLADPVGKPIEVVFPKD